MKLSRSMKVGIAWALVAGILLFLAICVVPRLMINP